MEKVNFYLSKELQKRIPTKILAWSGSRKLLPWFLFKSFFQSLLIIYRDHVTHVHLGDALLSPLGLLLKWLSKAKVTVTVHGLDVTYDKFAYQRIVPYCLKQLDAIICISRATMNECTKRGVDEKKCHIVYWGVYPDEFKISASKKDLENIVEHELSQKKVLLTVGRLVPRKGVSWFIENVLPKLKNDYLYLVVGDGSERENITEVIAKNRLENRVLLLGKVDDDKLKIIFNTADLFVMPNIPTENNIEGFGLVLIEACSAGLYAIASDMEGIRDAVLSERTGTLVKPLDTEGFVNAIDRNTTHDREDVRNETVSNFSWNKTAGSYIKIFSKV